MDRDEALRLLRNEKEGVAEWNRRRETGKEIPDLSVANLREADLSEANLHGADLSEASLIGADLVVADLSGANLHEADLIGANLHEADLIGANLHEANFSGANLHEADLSLANLHGANFSGANLSGANLDQVKMDCTQLGWTNITDTDLSEAESLETIYHEGRSSIGTDTLKRCGWKLPEEFLRGCGLAPWEILQAKLYNPRLTANQITELHYQIFDRRTHGPQYVGGVFISYSWDDSKFVDKLYSRLTLEGVSVWLDKHDMVAGSVQKQVARAIGARDVVIVVLSESSIESDWVENELDMARSKEKEQDRDVLCPVALDDSWKKRMENESSNRALWRNLTDKLIVDFAKWKTKAFEGSFDKLLRGMKINYEPNQQS